MKILLVQPKYDTSYIPLGLAKISTYYKKKKADVQFVSGRQELRQNFDKIFITSLFTYDYKIVLQTILFYKTRFPKAEIKVGGIFASLMPELVKKYTGIMPHVGIDMEYENEIPDYDLFPQVNYSIVHASRGCIRKCAFCMVHKLEPNYFHKKDWERTLNPKAERLVFFDNNWLAMAREDLLYDIERKKKIGQPYHFNQGLDCRLFTEEIAQLIPKHMEKIYFAWDNHGEDATIHRAIDLTRKYLGRIDTIIYTLFNFTDKPEYLYFRLREMLFRNNSVKSFLMKYKPLDTLSRKYIGKHWTETQLSNINTLNSYYSGNAIQQTMFYEVWGKDEADFMRRLNAPPHEVKQLLFSVKLKHKAKQING